MTYEQVVQIGESVGKHDFHFLSSYSWWQYIIYIGIFLLISYICIKLDNYGFAELPLALNIVLMAFFLPVISWGMGIAETQNLNDSEINDYKNQYAIPYISSLPSVENELIYLKVDNEAEVKGSFTFGTGSINSELLSIYSIMYKDGEEVIARNIKTSPKLTLAENENPYISYKLLNKPLPHYEEGLYNITLHLPKDYKFTDIK